MRFLASAWRFGFVSVVMVVFHELGERLIVGRGGFAAEWLGRLGEFDFAGENLGDGGGVELVFLLEYAGLERLWGVFREDGHARLV